MRFFVMFVTAVCVLFLIIIIIIIIIIIDKLNVLRTRKKSEPHMGFEPTTLRDLVGCSNHWATGDSMVSKGIIIIIIIIIIGNGNWTVWSTIQGVIALVRFWNYSSDCSLNCTTRGQITN